MKVQTTAYIEDYFNRFTNQAYLKEKVVQAVNALVLAAERGKILLCGNGGSAADCEHFAGELLKGFEEKRPLSEEEKRALKDKFGEDGAFIAAGLQRGVRCIPLTSFSAASTAFLNDCEEKLVFAQLTGALGEKGDVLIAISTSGNAKNVAYAAMTAKAKGMKVIALTGEKGGRLMEISDLTLNVPAEKTYLVQELHLPLYHLLCHAVESEIFI